MSIERLSRKMTLLVSLALLGAGFAACSGGEEGGAVDPGSEQSAPNSASTEVTPPDSAESVAGIPQCEPGCFGSEQACRDALIGRPDCFCTTDPGCCALPQFSMLCEP